MRLTSPVAEATCRTEAVVFPDEAGPGEGGGATDKGDSWAAEQGSGRPGSDARRRRLRSPCSLPFFRGWRESGKDGLKRVGVTSGMLHFRQGKYLNVRRLPQRREAIPVHNRMDSHLRSQRKPASPYG